MDTPTISYLKASPQHICELHIKKRFPEFYNIVKNITARSFSEKLYIHFNGTGKCLHCGNTPRYINFNEGYAQYCCLSCRSLHTRDKAKQTCMEKYGNPTYNNREKSIRTSIDRYGVDSWNKVPEKIEKTKRTCRDRYGVDCSFQSKSVQEKFKKTCRDRYGVDWYTQTDEMLEKSRRTCIEKYGVDAPAKYKPIAEKMKRTCRERYNHPYGPVGCSKKETALATWIQSQNIEVIQNYTSDTISEIDIYIPSMNIGFEFNGIYWHSMGHKPQKYHLNKTRLCYSEGIKLYHIWEHWDQLEVYEFVLDILGVKKSGKDFDKVFFKDRGKHIDINPELCNEDVKLKRRMHQRYNYYDSGLVVC